MRRALQIAADIRFWPEARPLISYRTRTRTETAGTACSGSAELSASTKGC